MKNNCCYQFVSCSCVMEVYLNLKERKRKGKKKKREKKACFQWIYGFFFFFFFFSRNLHSDNQHAQNTHSQHFQGTTSRGYNLQLENREIRVNTHNVIRGCWNPNQVRLNLFKVCCPPIISQMKKCIIHCDEIVYPMTI